MAEIELRRGDWIKVAREWALLDGSRPESRVEGRYGYYGCDTGCVGYRIYVVSGEGDENEKQVGTFHFSDSDAIKAAEKLGEELGLPVVMEKDCDW